jgi:alginate O-acetyltransferase complex protein AlgJ
MQASPVRRTLESFLIAMVLAVISLPLVGKLLPVEGAFALTENRRPTPLPTIHLGGPGWGYSIVSFPRRFERYWNDSFAFRWYLIRAHSLVKLALGVSPSPKALVGQDGYLFYAAEQSVDYFRNVKPFTGPELAHWREDLEQRREWLAGRGIRYLVVVAPDKETIYSEFMPPALRPVRPDSRLDQLLADLRLHSKVEVVDLRPALKRAKGSERVYHKTDTHWNDAGALVASREILTRLKTWFPEIGTEPPPGSLKVQWAAGGDLARILALEDRFREERIDWVPSASTRAGRIASDAGESPDVTVIECNSCGGPRVVMNQDSFNANLGPLLAERFTRIALVDGTKLDHALIEREKPALVIQEFVERALMCPDLHGC